LLKAADALEIARPNSGPYLVSTTAIAVENTHNFGGGTVQPISEIAALRKGADELGVALHLDGARIWNAHVASGVGFAEYGKYFDTISVCLSKGLGAPVGSIMLSTKERVAKARVWRKRYGAGMRQIGLLAAGAHYALDNNIDRLAEDHRRAQELATAIAAIDSSLIDPTTVHTNIVGLDLAALPITAAELAARCKDAGLWISALGPKYARLVTHLDFDDAQCAGAIEILKKALVA
jgi:threonine aldolase